MKIHKNLHVVAFVAAMMALGAQADPVTDQQVISAVSAWATANDAAFVGLGSAVAAKPMYDDDGANVLCWIVSMSNGGAVVAAPDTDLDLVIAVIEKYDGSFPEGHPLPSMLKADLKNRLSVISGHGTLVPNGKDSCYSGPASGAASGGATGNAGSTSGTAGISDAVRASMAAANAQWARYIAAGKTNRVRLRGSAMTDDSPYVRRIVDGFESDGRFTHWNQSQGIYNYYTPENEVCGCVATAGAAILQFFSCTNDPGEVASPVEGGCHLHGIAYPCTTMEGETDWTTLPKDYGGTVDGDLDEAGTQLLGRATYNMGVLVGMSWAEDGPGGESGALLKNLVGAFKQYGFKTARFVQYSGAEDSDGDEFFKTLYAQLWCGAPVALGIRGETGGHAVVACGYAKDVDGDEFCRVFMGWGGSGDSWYQLPKIRTYSTVENAVTMIGYEDDAVVPVCGEANISDIDLIVPGYITNDVAVTVHVDDQGYFGIRVPVSLTEKRLLYVSDSGRTNSVDILPFDSAKIGNEKTGRADLDKALPNEIYFPLMNMTVKQTMASARAVAERDGKALLMVSGTSGTKELKALKAYIEELDEVSDLSNRFVYVVLPRKSSNWNEPDGDPVIGVFDPDSFINDERWQESNARLDYENFIDYDTSGETNVVIHTFSADDEASLDTMKARVDELLEDGYEAYLARHAAIQVTVQGVNLATKKIGEEVAEVDPGYGVHADVWTDGEVAVFSALGAYTNEEAGVIYSCVGWTTNAVPAKLENLTDYTPGTEAQIQLSAGTTNTLTWVWDISHYRVTASLDRPYTSSTEWETAITPTNIWVAAGTRTTITAEETVGMYHFSSWRVMGTVEYDSYKPAAFSDNGAAVSFTVNEPVCVKATYRNGASGATTPTVRTVNFVSSPAELAAEAPLPVGESGFAWGENTSLDGYYTFRRETYTDATNGVWICTNVVTKGSSRAPGCLPFSNGDTVTFVWNLQTGGGGGSEPEPPTPTDITITGIEQQADGSWTITVGGAVKDCWYWLYAADDLAALAGDPWPAAKATTTESNPQQAEADGTIVFHATAVGSSCFWRAKATSTEDGN